MTQMLMGFGFGLAGIAGGYAMWWAGVRLARRQDALRGPDAN